MDWGKVIDVDKKIPDTSELVTHTALDTNIGNVVEYLILVG